MSSFHPITIIKPFSTYSILLVISICTNIDSHAANIIAAICQYLFTYAFIGGGCTIYRTD